MKEVITMTEINWSIIITRAGRAVASCALSTFDLSAPERMVEKLHEQYGACTIQVIDSTGKVWRKTWE